MNSCQVLYTKHLFGGGLFSTHPKNISQNGNLPQIGVKIKNIWDHHLVSLSSKQIQSMSCYLVNQPVLKHICCIYAFGNSIIFVKGSPTWSFPDWSYPSGNSAMYIHLHPGLCQRFFSKKNSRNGVSLTHFFLVVSRSYISNRYGKCGL